MSSANALKTRPGSRMLSRRRRRSTATANNSGTSVGKGAQEVLGLPRHRQIVFFSQVIILYTVILSCVVLLARGVGDSKLWSVLLCSCLGYMLPHPKLKRKCLGLVVGGRAEPLPQSSG